MGVTVKGVCYGSVTRNLKHLQFVQIILSDTDNIGNDKWHEKAVNHYCRCPQHKETRSKVILSTVHSYWKESTLL